MNARLKHALAALLPAPVRQAVRKWHCLRMLQRFRDDQWPGSAGARRLVRPGDHVVDAGANIGYVTMLLSRWVGSAGRVHSFEPIPQTFDVLSWIVRRLGLANVRLLPAALSDGHGEARMEIPHYAGGGENPYEARLVEADPSAGRRTVPVFRETLDALLGSDRPLIRFVKIDVEGHEGAALRGAEALIREAAPALMIEVSGDPDVPGNPAHTLFRWLAERGYQACVYEDDRFRDRRTGEKQIDYFFLTAAHRSRLASV
jgi:FkbM family methyltransferase